MSKPSLPVHLWFCMSLNPLTAQLVVTGVREGSREEALVVARQRRESPDDFVEVFDVMNPPHSVPLLRAWLRSKGVPSRQATELIRSLAEQMLELSGHGAEEDAE